MVKKKPGRAGCLDEACAGNDQLKANAAQSFKGKAVTSVQMV